MLLSFQIVFGQNKEPIKSGILNGKAIQLPKPDYPQNAKDSCAGGKVEVEVLVSEKGDVIEAKAISGDELLRESSVEAAKKVKFSQNSHFLVKVRGILIYNFDPFVKCISSGIVNKKAVNLPKPKVANIIYPKHLRITKEEIVAVQIVINMEGKVIAATAISGHPMLQSPCKNAARQAKFSPIIATMPPIKIRALLVYKFKPDGTIDTDIERDDKSVIGTPINLVEPPPPSCNCRGLGGSVLVQTKINEQGNVIEAKAISGHPFLRFSSEKAALGSKFLPTDTKAKILISYNFESNDGGRTAKIKNVEIEQIEIEK